MRKRKEKSLTFQSRKANAIIDSTYLIVVVLFLSITFLMSGVLFDKLNEKLSPQVTGQAATILSDKHTSYFTTFDAIFITVLIGLWIGAIVSSFLIDSHPIFLIISVLGLLIIFVVAMFFSNVWDEASSATSDMASTAEKLPITGFIMDNLLIVIIFIAGTILLALYGKQTRGFG